MSAVLPSMKNIAYAVKDDSGGRCRYRLFLRSPHTCELQIAVLQL